MSEAAVPSSNATVVLGVELVRWPSDDGRRRQLAAAGEPRLLLLGPEYPPPTVLDGLEDWVQDTTPLDEVAARATTLSRRALQRSGSLHLDTDGLLRFGSRWVAIPDAQLPVVELLVERPHQLVRTEAIVEAYASAGGCDGPGAIRTLLARINGRVKGVGLTLRSVRGRGVVLEELPELPPPPTPPAALVGSAALP